MLIKFVSDAYFKQFVDVYETIAYTTQVRDKLAKLQSIIKTTCGGQIFDSNIHDANKKTKNEIAIKKLTTVYQC